jgi:hypothetical protein
MSLPKPWNTRGSTWSARYFCRILTKFGFFGHLMKATNTKFHENPSSCYVRTDSHDKANTYTLFATMRTRLKIGSLHECVYDVTSTKYLECLYSWLSYPACKSHLLCAVLYCNLWPVWLYHISPHYLINGTTFGNDLLNIKCVFWFFVQLLSEIFLILRRIQRYIIINIHRSSCKVPVILVRF